VAQIQGALRLIWELEEALKTITGMPGVTLSPAAGAHGELTGILMIRQPCNCELRRLPGRGDRLR